MTLHDRAPIQLHEIRRRCEDTVRVRTTARSDVSEGKNLSQIASGPIQNALRWYIKTSPTPYTNPTQPYRQHWNHSATCLLKRTSSTGFRSRLCSQRKNKAGQGKFEYSFYPGLPPSAHCPDEHERRYVEWEDSPERKRIAHELLKTKKFTPIPGSSHASFLSPPSHLSLLENARHWQAV